MIFDKTHRFLEVQEWLQQRFPSLNAGRRSHDSNSVPLVVEERKLVGDKPVGNALPIEE